MEDPPMSIAPAASAPSSSSSVDAAHLAGMHLALAEAAGALAEEEVPVGCVILHTNSRRLLATGRNQTNATKNGTRHCEFVALESLAQNPDPTVRDVNLADCTLYVTVEPCIMCGSALRLAGIGLVVFGCSNERFGGNGSTLPLHECPSIDADNATAADASSGLPPLQGTGYPIVRGVMATEAVDILKRFYARGNQNIPLERRHRKGVAAAAAEAAAAEATAATAANATTDPALIATPPTAPIASSTITPAVSTGTVSPITSATPIATTAQVAPADTPQVTHVSAVPPLTPTPTPSLAQTPPSAAPSARRSNAAPPATPQRRIALKGEDAWKRMNYLYQSSHLLSVSDSLAGSNLSRFYVMNLKKIAAKLVMRIDPSVKNSLCKRCGSLLLPGHTAEVQVLSAGDAERPPAPPQTAHRRTPATTHDDMEDVAPAVTLATDTATAAAAAGVASSPIAASSLVATASPAQPTATARGRRRRHRTHRRSVTPVHVVMVCRACTTRRRVHTKPPLAPAVPSAAPAAPPAPAAAASGSVC